EARAETEKRYVRPGDHVILVESSEKLVVNANTSDSAVVVADPATPPKHWMIAYSVANPPKAPGESVGFTEGAKARTIDVIVSAYPQPDNASVMAQAGGLLFSMLVLAVILESAFAVL